MTRRFFLGNFDFEHRLAEPNRPSSKNLQRLNAELATAWLSIANDGDWIWTPSPIAPEFFRDAVRAGLSDVVPATSFADVPKDVECIPWGWSADIIELVRRFGWKATFPPEDAVRIANSRATSDAIEREWHIGLETAERIHSMETLNHAVRSSTINGGAWVVKAEFGMSARERILGRGPLTIADENWVRRRLKISGVVFFEPWVERVGEVGMQFEIPQSGQPIFIGFSPMSVDRRGQYSGSWFAFDDSQFPLEKPLWRDAADMAMRACGRLQSIGYFGPVGIDAMVYRVGTDQLQTRALQDINARWTMGRLSLGWKRLLKSGERGFWQHDSSETSPAVAFSKSNRIVPTSPDLVGDCFCQHRSQIVIEASEIHEPLLQPSP